MGTKVNFLDKQRTNAIWGTGSIRKYTFGLGAQGINQIKFRGMKEQLPDTVK